MPLLQLGLDSSGGTGFVRERLALLAKTLFLVSFGFWLFLLASLTLIGGADAFAVVRGPVALGHICASLTMAALWFVTTRARWSLKALGALDAGAFALAGVFLAFMTVTDESQILQVLLALLVTAMFRAIIMPSRPGRTALITALIFLPTVVICIARHHPTNFLPGFSPGYQKLHMTLNTILWAVLGTVVATIVSRVLYGLRRQVAEASELGQYLLEEKIGGGGMGEVWRARHRLLIRPAAIKIIRAKAVPGMATDPELLVRRFEREARATAALTSPHTVQLYDFGVAEDGRLYYVMELLDGLDLDTLVRQYGPLPPERVVHILRQVCAALQDAHANGLVHRDIKPANIVVSRAGTTYDFVKVLDFGLVKLDSPARARGAETVKLSTEDSWSGTPGYMAPEVVMGATETDHRVDIYALGCVAYWLLTGKLVFEGENAMQVMMQHVTAEPRRPSARIGRALPAALEALVMECLEKDPGRRPASAEVVGERLAAVQIPEVWTAEQAEQWWEAHRPGLRDPRPVADVLLSHEGHELRIGPRMRPGS
ncbi:MAG TPA: serine/threonine-protein kinase [Gemmatimonadales bacterium]|nr:serine/threonine-protein kinase [Gemmatimonadales bacterium]